MLETPHFLLMIAITLGVGSYYSMAQCSARLVRDHCGIPTYVAGDNDAMRFRVGLPHFLKFYIFDMTSEENIMFFDPDILTVSSYDPRAFANLAEIVAVRDVSLSFSAPESGFLGFCSDDYFNAGWFVVNRTHHADLFHVCRDASRHVSALWKSGDHKKRTYRDPTDGILTDQGVLNSLVAKKRIPILLVDRRFNYMMFEPAAPWVCVENVNSIHLFSEKKRHFFSLLESVGKIQYLREISESGFFKLSGKWICEGGSCQHHILELRQDGTIAGSSIYRHWLLTSEDQLVLCDTWGIKLQLHEQSDGTWVADTESARVRRTR